MRDAARVCRVREGEHISGPERAFREEKSFVIYRRTYTLLYTRHGGSHGGSDEGVDSNRPPRHHSAPTQCTLRTAVASERF